MNLINTPAKVSKIYKNTELNTANFSNFTHNDYQVYLHLISKINKIDEQGSYLETNQLNREYTLSALEFSQMFNMSLSNSYPALKQAIDKLMKTDIKIALNGKNFCRVNVCSKAEYYKNEGYINIKFTDDIMPYLAQVKERFIMYNIKEIANFGSLYTTRLYELIQEFKQTGWMLKSIAQLRESFAVSTNKLIAYADFKKKTFKHACEEINAQYHMNLTFEEIKEGRKVVAIKFLFNKTEVNQVANRITGKIRNVYNKPKAKILKGPKLKVVQTDKNKFIDKNVKSIIKEPAVSTIIQDDSSSVQAAKPIGNVISSLLSKWLPSSK